MRVRIIMEKEIIIEQLKRSDYKRLFKTFKIKGKYYLYDSGTGKVLQCEHKEYKFLEDLWISNSYECIVEAYKNSPEVIENLVKEIMVHNLLLAPPLIKFELSNDQIVFNANNRLEQITLELTQLCNLACKYCIYQESNIDFRNFDIKKMTWDIAKRAIDYAMEHSGKNVSITFYGGEPLLEFEILKKCVLYSKTFADKAVDFSMTTNLTLINEEIANFLAAESNFYIVCSLDGPQTIHDDKRLLKSGDGSYSKAIAGLKKLVEALGKESKDRISLSMVISPPVSRKKLTLINNFFNCLTWLPQDIVKNISYEKISSEIEKTHFKDEKMGNYKDPISNWSTHADYENFAQQFLRNKMRKIHKRIISEKPLERYCMNGCCCPASRRLYITVEGDFLICERIGSSPKIGNVFDGLNSQVLLKNYYEDYIEKSISDCSKCWAVHLCSICFLEAYNEQGFSIEKKEIACQRLKLILEDELKTYYMMLENGDSFLSTL